MITTPSQMKSSGSGICEKQAEVNSVVKDEQMRLIQDLQDFIKSQPTTITEFDET